MAFKDEFKKYRELKEFTQEDIADAIGISRQSVSKWENGNSEPDIETIKQLALIFDCSTDQLLGFVSNETRVSRAKTAQYKKFIKISLISICSMVLIIGILLLCHFLQPGISGNLTPAQKGFIFGPYFPASELNNRAFIVAYQAGYEWGTEEAFLYGSNLINANYHLVGDYYYYNNYPIPTYGFLITAIVFGSLTIIFGIVLLVIVIKHHKRPKVVIKQ